MVDVMLRILAVLLVAALSGCSFRVSLDVGPENERGAFLLEDSYELTTEDWRACTYSSGYTEIFLRDRTTLPRPHIKAFICSLEPALVAVVRGSNPGPHEQLQCELLFYEPQGYELPIYECDKISVERPR